VNSRYKDSTSYRMRASSN